ncbi:hypothetical protein [Kitasatospora sp. NPDC017646]|uniref:hypothetical protein n=1 Tax=Kitasatospora sp. NPDC017646 TaxID=3364024 RepID=UPI00379ABADC
MFTALLLSLSAGGHILLTGAPLPATVMATAAVAVFGAALLRASVERAFVQIAAVLFPLELALNADYNVGQDACGTGSRASGGLLPACCAAVAPSTAWTPYPSCRGRTPSPPPHAKKRPAPATFRYRHRPLGSPE